MPIAQHFEQVAVSKLSPSALKALKKALTEIYGLLDVLEEEAKVVVVG
jgi:hypothetical protein